MKSEMNTNEHRDILIQRHSLQSTYEIHTFYYYETKSIRRLYLKDTGLNANETDNFILAEILHRGLSTDSDYSALFTNLNIQKVSVR